MPRYIVKAAPDIDLYVEWSTVVDNFIWSGTREELVKYGQFSGWRLNIEERIARADATGTSAMWEDWEGSQEGSWEDERFLVTNVENMDGYFWLNRDDLAAYVAGDNTVLEFIPDEE